MAPKSKLTRSKPSALRSKSFIGSGSRASARRVWPILIIFLVIIALIIGGVITLLRRNATTSQATTFTSQPLSDEAQISLRVAPLAPEDYLIGGNLDIAGALGVNTITSSADMLIGSTEHAILLQGSDVSLAATSGGVTNTLRFATPSGTSKTIVLPNASGTVAVSASGPLVLDANGNLSCPSCIGGAVASAPSVGSSTPASPSASFNAITGDILLQGTANQITITNNAGGRTVTVSLPQDINTSASPIFANLNITQSLQVANAITAGSLTLDAPLAVSSGGTGASIYTDGQLLIGDSSNGGLTVATLTAGSGVTITTGNGAITVSAPTAGTCPSCANVSLSNLSGVAINTSLLAGTNNTIDVGSVAATFRSGYYGTSVHSASFDTVTAGQLSIGTGTATSITLGADTNIAAGKSLTVNGTALFQNAINSTTAFQVQDSAGVALLNANTTQGTLSVGTYVPTTVYTPLPVTVNSYLASAWMNAVVTADFNGDGNADIASVSDGNGPGFLEVFMNNGTGTFPAGRVSYPAGTYPRSVTTADFNGDGKADLVVVNQTNSTVSVFINNGNGTFAAKVDYATGFSPRSVTTADFNGDGTSDLAVSNGSSNTISVFLNNGIGTFAAKVDFATGTTPYAITSADFNNDGKADLATANYSSNTVSVLLGSGTGTFAAKVDYATGTNPYAITSADFDGDGHADLAVTNYTSGTISVFINTGIGTFAPKVDSLSGHVNPTGITSVDLSGDGKADLAVTSYDHASAVSVFINSGTGTFASKVDYAPGSPGRRQSVASADFNNDGQIDLVANAWSSLSYIVVIRMAGTTSAVMTQTSSKLVVNATPNVIGQLIQGTVGQTADLLQARNDTNGILLSVGATGNVVAAGTLSVTGAITASSALTVASTVTASGAMNVAGTFTSTGSALFRNTTNSTTAFRVQQANATTVFGVDTTNGRVGIGSATPANKLSVNTLTTADTTAQVAIGTAGAANKGLVLQGYYGQTANMFEAQNSTGVVMASIGANGAATFKNVIDSVSAFQIQNSSGQAFLAADTTNGTISIGSPIDRYIPMSKVDYATGAGPMSGTTADFNGDGKPDLATANNSANTVSVLMNNGDGTLATKVDYVTATGARSVTTADFNGDGKADLATANSLSDTVSVFINNGDGTFAAKVDYATGAGPHSITTADFNGDGKPDLAIVNYSASTLSVLMNTGTGTFAAKVDYVTGAQPISITTADFNGDGKADLAVANNGNGANTVSVLMNTGTGTFAAKVDYATGFSPRDVASGDLNSDGKPDLAVVNINSNTVSVLMNTGTGTFAAKVDYATGTAPYAIAIADSNNDGIRDVAVVNYTSNTMSVFLGTGTGTLSAKTDSVTSSGSYDILSTDLNTDLKTDLVSVNGGISVFMNGGVISTAPKLVVNTSFASVGQIIQAATGQTADLLQVKDSTNNTLHSIGATGSTLFKNTTNSTNAFQIQDSAGAALLNANTTQGTLSVGTYVPTTVWAAAANTSVDYPIAATPRAPVSADFNGDGKPDLAITTSGATDAVSVLINNGNGTFAAKVDYVTGASPYNMTTGDFNGDGNPDLAVANLSSATVSVFINNGNGTFAAKVDYYVTGAGPQSIAAADFNGDGKADLVVTGSNVVSVFLNTGTGTFAAYVNYATSGSVATIATADFNGDGKPDIAAANTSPTRTVSILINNGNGTFAAKVDYGAGIGTNSVGASYMTAADFNGDGKIDLSTLDYSNDTISILINNGNGTFASRVDYTTVGLPIGMTTGDFNGDGKSDLAAVSYTSHTISILINNGDGTFATKVDYSDYALNGPIISDDFNGDGKTDLAASKLPTAIRVILFGETMTGTVMTQAHSKLVVNATPNVVGQIIQATANQTADLLQVKDDINTTLFSVGATGNVAIAGSFTSSTLFKNITNSTTAFQIQQANATTVFGVDTTNGRVGIGTAAPVHKLSVNTLTTAAGNTTTQVAIGTSAAGNKGLVLQGVASQTANLFEAQNSTGAVMASIGATGATTFKNSVDSSAALRIQNSSGLAFFNADSINSTISIGSSDRYTSAAKVDYVTGTSPSSVSSADFNGDSRADLAVVNVNSTSISVFLNDGAGSFVPKSDYASSTGPNSVSSADYNNDGAIDLAVSNRTSNTISLFINNGNGTFAAKVDYVTGTNPEVVASADYNNDGAIDLAVTNYGSSTVSVFINNGNGTFAAKVDYVTGTNPQGITSSDFNADGKTDLAVVNTVSNTVSIFINNGNGTFATKVDYATGTTPRSVTAADLNGDNKTDLAVTNYGSNTVSVFINNGYGIFGSKIDYATGAQSRSVISADFNGDNKADLVTANVASNTISMLTKTTVYSSSAKLVVTTSVSAVGQVIQSASGQTADLLQVKDSTNGTLYSVGATGNVLFKNNVNSMTAFQVQQANATTVFGVDTTNGRVGIGTIAPANKLSVNDLTTADAFAQLAISTGITTNKGLIVQGVLNQTADLLQAQSSTGAILVSISATGTLTVASAVVNGTLTVNGHIITSGTVPTVEAGVAACTAPTIFITGNDTSGKVTITTGTGCALTGHMATVTFNSAFGAEPLITLTPNNAQAAQLQLYTNDASISSFTIDTATPTTDATTYKFNYLVVQ